MPTGSKKPTIQIVSVEDASGLSWLLLRDYEPISRFDQYEDAEAMMQQMPALTVADFGLAGFDRATLDRFIAEVAAQG